MSGEQPAERGEGLLHPNIGGRNPHPDPTPKQYLSFLCKRLRQLKFVKNPRMFTRLATSEMKMRMGIPQLRSLEFAVTWACNKTCAFCYAEDLMYADDRNKKHIPISVVKDVVSQAHELGLVHINVTGGEPLVRTDLFELLDVLPRDVVVTVVTNSTLLTREKIDRFKEVGVSSLQMSFGENYKEDYQHEMARYAVSRGVEVCLSVVNIVEERAWVEKALALAEELDGYVLFNYPMKFAVDAPLYERERYSKYVREDNFFWAGMNRCPAGVEKLYMTNDGEVMICDRIHNVFGSVYSEPLKEIWGRLVKDFNKKDRPYCLLQSCVSCPGQPNNVVLPDYPVVSTPDGIRKKVTSDLKVPGGRPTPV